MTASTGAVVHGPVVVVREPHTAETRRVVIGADDSTSSRAALGSHPWSDVATTTRGKTMRVHRGLITTTGVAAAALLLAGCGGGSDALADASGEEVLDAAQEAMAEVSSFRMKGSITDEGQELGIDVQVSESGDCTGSMTIDEASVEVLSVDGEDWIRPDRSFWELQSGATGPDLEQLLAIVEGKWVSDDDGTAEEICDLQSLFEDEGDEGDAEKGEVTDLDGEEVVPVTYTDDEDELTAFVRASEPHHMLELRHATEGSIAFSEFDEDFSVEAPPADEQVDLDEIAG
ncbi:MAG: hypothetical protein Q8Q02_10755 [Nocardioides sp.]|nr:hypothetical protein [Nocardioides sp.]